MPKVVVLVNGRSGTGRDKDCLTQVQEALARGGLRAEVAQTDGKRLAEQGRKAVQDGATLLVAAGGDGTVSALAGAVLGTEAALGVLPIGTLNHFAKDAGIPLDLDQAAAALARGHGRHVDAAEVNGHVFVNNSSVGVYPAAVRERNGLQAQGSSKRLAMLRAAGSVLRQVPAHHLHLSLDGQVTRRSTSFLVVANNRYDLGFGMLGRRTALDTGMLGVYTMRRPGRRALLGLAARALVGRLDQARDFEEQAGRELVADSARPTLRAGIDGELVELRPPLRFRIHPRALRLVGAGGGT